MKKNVKAVFAGMAAAALLAGFASCSNGSSDDALNNAASSSTTSSTDSTTTTPNASQTDTNKEDVFSGDLITYVISVASAEDADHTKLILQYDRSAAGAKEQISLTNVELAVSVNNEAVTMPSKLEFALDEYSSFEKDPGAKEDDADKQKTYKCIIDLNKALAVNDTVKVELKKATVTGEGASTVKLGSIVATVVDTAKAANYWREMSETKYQTLITKKNGGDLNATVVVTPPADNTNTPTDTTTTPATPAADPATPANPSTTPATDPAANPSTPANNPSPAPAATAPTITWSESVINSLEKNNFNENNEDVGIWGSGTHITGDTAPYTVTHGTTWDPSGMATMPIYSGSLAGFNYILVDINTSNFSFRGDSTEYPSFEVKVEYTDNSAATFINGTNTVVNGIYYIPLSSVSDVSKIKQFTLNLRGTGTLTLTDVKKAKDN